MSDDILLDIVTRLLGVPQTPNRPDVLDISRNLPDDLSPERRAMVEKALSLVGKVNYFWGGKSRAIGWDSRWGSCWYATVPTA